MCYVINCCGIPKSLITYLFKYLTYQILYYLQISTKCNRIHSNLVSVENNSNLTAILNGVLFRLNFAYKNYIAVNLRELSIKFKRDSIQLHVSIFEYHVILSLFTIKEVWLFDQIAICD